MEVKKNERNAGRKKIKDGVTFKITITKKYVETLKQIAKQYQQY